MENNNENLNNDLSVDIEKKEETVVEKTPLQKMLETFETSKLSFTNELKDIFSDMDDKSKLAKVQVRALSLRHNVADSIYNFNKMLIKFKKSEHLKRGEYLNEAYQNLDYKLSPTHINQFIDSKTANTIQILMYLEGFISYLNNLLKTIDSISFNLKLRYDLMEVYVPKGV